MEVARRQWELPELPQCAAREKQGTARLRHGSARERKILYTGLLGSLPRFGMIRHSVPDSSSTNGFDPEALASAAGVRRVVHCGPTPLGRGLVAPHALERQAIVSVPLQNTLVITDEPLSGISIFGDRCQALWQEHHGPLPQQLLDFLTGDARWDVRMTAWLLWVASELPDSPVWGPYLESLPPAEEVTCLLNYAPDDARELQFKELVEEARTQHSWGLSVHRDYFDGERGELRQLGLATRAADTLWAMSMVRTRTFSEDVNGEALTLMVPYADMANHSFTFNATFCMARDNKRFELRLLYPLSPGEEATICYGESKPNFEVMRDYGFVVPSNPNDRVTGLPNQDTLPPLNGASLLEALGLKGDWREGAAKLLPKAAPMDAAPGDPASQLALARKRNVILSMKLSDGFPASSGGGGLFGGWPGAKSWTAAGRPPPQSLRGGAAAVTAERASVAAVRQSYQAALDELPTSIEEDEAILQAAAVRQQCEKEVVSSSGEGAKAGTGAGAGEDVAAAAAAVAALPPPPSSPLRLAAVRCRLEHKLLLREAVLALDVYDKWLDERQRLR
ncbi:hypothetical protein PLESTB_000604500 [Pleodorina starrii]|uniref:SET domain-containing protein n=1 Tax=Pleodorina starrii TaxID=330485 RepID=A0A9W6BI81_9CHLO|nr:hypothetical protein PLESTB_000604500 [Pleodorina starrii]